MIGRVFWNWTGVAVDDLMRQRLEEWRSHKSKDVKKKASNANLSNHSSRLNVSVLSTRKPSIGVRTNLLTQSRLTKLKDKKKVLMMERKERMRYFYRDSFKRNKSLLSLRTSATECAKPNEGCMKGNSQSPKAKLMKENIGTRAKIGGATASKHKTAFNGGPQPFQDPPSHENVQKWLNIKGKPLENYGTHIHRCFGHDPKSFTISRPDSSRRPRSASKVKTSAANTMQTKPKRRLPVHSKSVNMEPGPSPPKASRSDTPTVDKQMTLDDLKTPERSSDKSGKNLRRSSRMSAFKTPIGSERRTPFRELNGLQNTAGATPASSVVKFCLQFDTPVTNSIIKQRYSVLKTPHIAATPAKTPVSELRRMSVVTPVRRSMRVATSCTKLPKILQEPKTTELHDDLSTIPAHIKENMVFRSNRALHTFSEYGGSPDF